MKRKYKIVSRFRFTLFVVITILVFVCTMNIILGFNTADSLTKVEYKDYVVAYGDTLWNIAKNHSDNSTDIRQAVYELCQVNNITAKELYAGMTIKIPIQNI